MQRYTELTPEIWDELGMFKRLFGSSEIKIAARLQELGLLPAAVKSRITERVVQLASDLPDSDFLHRERLYNLFSLDEINVMFTKVIARMAPAIDHIIDDWSSDFYGSDDDPDTFFEPLLDCLEELYSYTNDPETEKLLQAAIRSAEGTLEQVQFDYRRPEPDTYERYDARSAITSQGTERDIFDDVDQ